MMAGQSVEDVIPVMTPCFRCMAELEAHLRQVLVLAAVLVAGLAVLQQLRVAVQLVVGEADGTPPRPCRHDDQSPPYFVPSSSRW